MKRKSRKHFAAHFEIGIGGEEIVKGTANYPRYANGHLPRVKGVDTYGTKLIDGVTCLKVAKYHANILKGLGWTIVSKKEVYAYVTPPARIA